MGRDDFAAIADPMISSIFRYRPPGPIRGRHELSGTQHYFPRALKTTMNFSQMFAREQQGQPVPFKLFGDCTPQKQEPLLAVFSILQLPLRNASGFAIGSRRSRRAIVFNVISYCDR